MHTHTHTQHTHTSTHTYTSYPPSLPDCLPHEYLKIGKSQKDMDIHQTSQMRKWEGERVQLSHPVVCVYLCVCAYVSVYLQLTLQCQNILLTHLQDLM